jgi:hypothetical protein
MCDQAIGLATIQCILQIYRLYAAESRVPMNCAAILDIRPSW